MFGKIDNRDASKGPLRIGEPTREAATVVGFVLKFRCSRINTPDNRRHLPVSVRVTSRNQNNLSWMISMFKLEKFALTFLVVAGAVFSITGCRTGGNRPAQVPYASAPSYSQGSGTVTSPAYDSGSGSRTTTGPAYNSSGSNSRSYDGGSGTR